MTCFAVVISYNLYFNVARLFQEIFELKTQAEKTADNREQGGDGTGPQRVLRGGKEDP